MAILGISDIISAADDIIGKFVPDADKRIEASIELAKIADGAAERSDAQLSGQIDVDKTEAASSNIFVAGWRPFIGWTCGVTLAYTWVVAPITQAVLHLATMPIIPTDQIYPIVMAMLGIGTLRTVEKSMGVATGAIPGATLPQGVISKVTSWFK